MGKRNLNVMPNSCERFAGFMDSAPRYTLLSKRGKCSAKVLCLHSSAEKVVVTGFNPRAMLGATDSLRD